MGIELTKQSIDLGIVTTDGDAALAFYRDTLGLRQEPDLRLGTGVMHRLWCGDSLIKILVHDKPPADQASQGGIQAATGYRYWTISVRNLPQVVAACADAGYKIAVPEREIRPGVSIAMIEDPDGNWVELLSQSSSQTS